MLNAPNQTRLPAVDGSYSNGQHSREAQAGVYGGLLKASELEAPQQKPLLSPAKQPFHAPPPLEQLHKPPRFSSHEVPAHLQGVLDPGVPPNRNHRLRTEVPSCLPNLG